MQYTTNYNLGKPDPQVDSIGPEPFNADMDVIDAALHGLEAGKLSIAGGTLTGPLTLAGDPIDDLEAASKAYVDEKAAKYTLIQSYTAAGSYTYTPDFTGEVLVCMIGGGGSGAASAHVTTATSNYGQSPKGGMCGDVLVGEFDVASGTGVPVVVGAGGASQTATLTGNGETGPQNLPGITGGSSSFAGVTATGGAGGEGVYGSIHSAFPGATIAVSGDAAFYGGVPSHVFRYNSDTSSIAAIIKSSAYDAFLKMGRMLGDEVPFYGANAGGLYATTTLPNGEHTSPSQASYGNKVDTTASVGPGTDCGCGGGTALAVVYGMPGGTTHTATATAAAGMDGGVFIYRKM